MAVDPKVKLPPPPADLASRQLPLTQIEGAFYRIHRQASSALYFGRKGCHRFDDPQKRYGVLYASLKPEAAFAEVFLRQLDLMLVSESALAERLLSELRSPKVPCVNLTAHGLRQVSADGRIADELPYDMTQRWSRAFYEHPSQPGGILYRSRHNPMMFSLALFSRAEAQLQQVKSEHLLGVSLRRWTAGQLKKYRICLRSA